MSRARYVRGQRWFGRTELSFRFNPSHILANVFSVSYRGSYFPLTLRRPGNGSSYELNVTTLIPRTAKARACEEGLPNHVTWVNTWDTWDVLGHMTTRDYSRIGKSWLATVDT